MKLIYFCTFNTVSHYLNVFRHFSMLYNYYNIRVILNTLIQCFNAITMTKQCFLHCKNWMFCSKWAWSFFKQNLVSNSWLLKWGEIWQVSWDDNVIKPRFLAHEVFSVKVTDTHWQTHAFVSLLKNVSVCWMENSGGRRSSERLCCRMQSVQTREKDFLFFSLYVYLLVCF